MHETDVARPLVLLDTESLDMHSTAVHPLCKRPAFSLPVRLERLSPKLTRARAACIRTL